MFGLTSSYIPSSVNDLLKDSVVILDFQLQFLKSIRNTNIFFRYNSPILE
jgi:hypothetical protein